MSMFGQSKAGTKPTASLSSTLLARKGHAKPAMRPQGFGGFGSFPGTDAPGAQDDLGWNDMGFDGGFEHDPADVAPAAPVAVPPVLVQREALREEFEPVEEVAYAPAPAPVKLAVVKPVSVATATRLGRETSAKRGKAAFTLRLDHDRHLRLRIASALSGRSAQVLVTDALDHYLETLPEVDALIAQLPPRKIR